MCIMTAQSPAGVITVHIACSVYSISATGHINTHPVCAYVCMCEGMMTSRGCTMSFSACLAEADVLVGQNWRALLPCVRITRWPLFPATSCQIHPWKNELSKLSERPTSTTVKCTREKRKGVCLYPVRKSCRAVLNRSAAVSSNLFDSREMVKENIAE